MKALEGFALGRLTRPLTFEINSAGPQAGQYDPTPRYPDGTPIEKGFSTGSGRGRKPGGTVGVGHSADAKAQMIERYKAGEGLQVLAAAYSTNVTRVRGILIQAGVTIRPFGGQKNDEQRSNDMALTKDQVKQLYKLADKGMERGEIAATLGITAQGVVYHLRKRAAKAGKVAKATPKPRVSYSDEEVVQIHGRYMAGESLEIMYAAGVFEVTPETITKNFRRLNLAFPRPKAEAQADCITTVSHPGHAAAATALREYGFSEEEIAAAIAKDQPQPELPKEAEPVTKVTTAPPAPTSDGQMDDPEMSARPTAVSPFPTIPEATDELARQRARELHRKAQGVHMVVAVQELPVAPVLARKQYSAPRILESGAMFVNNPHAAAKLVENLVAELNQVPGVQAYFEWRSQGSVGQPLAR